MTTKKILLLGTGGTIAALSGPEGMRPAYSAGDLLGFIPDVLNKYTVESVQLMNIDSTNMRMTHWLQIGAALRDALHDHDGFVVTHGTDTMAYTAAVLSYMIQHFPKPVVLTGSQKPIGARATDAKRNLSDAIRFASEDFPGVWICFNGKIINGTRAVKVRTRSKNAFYSIDFPQAALVNGDCVAYKPAYPAPQKGTEPEYFMSMAEDVILIKLTPGVDKRLFEYIKGRYRGLVLESFGSGGLPFDEEAGLLRSIADLSQHGTIVVLTTQCLFEGGDLDLYEVGRKALQSHVIPAYDMTTEAAVAKLMWALGISSDYDTVKKMFLTPVNHDIFPDGKI